MRYSSPTQPTNRASYAEQESRTREQLALLKELTWRPAPAQRLGMLREDVENLDNAARADLQRGMGGALGASLEISALRVDGATRTVEGVLRLGQTVRFSFTSAQPDGCLITCENLELSEKTAAVLSKLQAYYTSWYNQVASDQNAS